MSQLGNALFNKTQQKLLGLLYTQPDRSFYLKEILRITEMGVATIKSELDRFLTSGILRMKKIGNQHHYQANPDCPIYEELRAIVRKTFGITDLLRDALQTVDKQIELAFVYGSIAKGEETTKSDIDLFVISEIAFGDLMKILNDSEQAFGRDINPSIYTRKQIKTKLKQKNSFLTRVFNQPKLWVKGSDDDIEKLG